MNLKNRDLEYQNLIQSNNLTLPTKNDSTLFYTDTDTDTAKEK